MVQDPKKPTKAAKRPSLPRPGRAKNRSGKPTTLYFSDDLKGALQGLAKKHDRPMAREIERALRAWLYLHDALPEELELPDGLPRKHFPKN